MVRIKVGRSEFRFPARFRRWRKEWGGKRGRGEEIKVGGGGVEVESDGEKLGVFFCPFSLDF